MKKIIFLLTLAVASFTAFAQEKTASKSKWKETKNGVSYEMEAKMKGTVTKNVENPHITLNFKGNLEQLSKVALTKKNELYVTVPVVKGGQNINVEPGSYTFKLYHEKLGMQEFVVDLKKNDYKELVFTLN